MSLCAALKINQGETAYWKILQQSRSRALPQCAERGPVNVMRRGSEYTTEHVPCTVMSLRIQSVSLWVNWAIH